MQTKVYFTLTSYYITELIGLLCFWKALKFVAIFLNVFVASAMSISSSESLNGQMSLNLSNLARYSSRKLSKTIRPMNPKGIYYFAIFGQLPVLLVFLVGEEVYDKSLGDEHVSCSRLLQKFCQAKFFSVCQSFS